MKGRENRTEPERLGSRHPGLIRNRCRSEPFLGAIEICDGAQPGFRGGNSQPHDGIS